MYKNENKNIIYREKTKQKSVKEKKNQFNLLRHKKNMRFCE